MSVCFAPNKNVNPFGLLLPAIAIASMWETAAARTCLGLVVRVARAADTCCQEDSGTTHPVADFVCRLWY